MPENKQAIIFYTRKTDEGKILLNIDALPAQEKKQLNSLTQQLNSAMQAHASSMLTIGKVLCDIRNLLSDRGDAMKGYINMIPGFAQATAYRYMARYEEGTKKLTTPLLNRVLARGIEMIGVKEETPFGRYTEAVKKVQDNPKLPSIKDCKDEKTSEQFINAVVAEYQKAPVGGKQKVTREDLEHQATKYVYSCWKRLEEKDRKVTFLSRVFGYILDMTSFDVPMSVNPLKPPSHWAEEKHQNAKKAGRPKKESKKTENDESDD